MHIDKRVAIGTRTANQNPEFRRICQGVPIEANPGQVGLGSSRPESTRPGQVGLI